jgi:hypothetical protein
MVEHRVGTLNEVGQILIRLDMLLCNMGIWALGTTIRSEKEIPFMAALRRHAGRASGWRATWTSAAT